MAKDRWNETAFGTVATITNPVALKNVAGSQVNPATEDKQDTIVTALGTISGKYPFEDYQYMGSQTISTKVYYGFKQYGGTGWYIMRKDTTDDAAWKYAYSPGVGTTFAVAWAAPASESYNNPPDS